jgi:hypothetical protein
MRKLELIGNDSWSRPAYKDEASKLWKDVNLGYCEPSLHDSVGNGFEGEPNSPIEGDYTISASKNLFDSFSEAERHDFNIDDWISREVISSYESNILDGNAMQRSPDDYSNSIEAAKSNTTGNKNMQVKQDPVKSADVLR